VSFPPQKDPSGKWITNSIRTSQSGSGMVFTWEVRHFGTSTRYQVDQVLAWMAAELAVSLGFLQPADQTRFESWMISGPIQTHRSAISNMITTTKTEVVIRAVMHAAATERNVKNFYGAMLSAAAVTSSQLAGGTSTTGGVNHHPMYGGRPLGFVSGFDASDVQTGSQSRVEASDLGTDVEFRVKLPDFSSVEPVEMQLIYEAFGVVPKPTILTLDALRAAYRKIRVGFPNQFQIGTIGDSVSLVVYKKSFMALEMAYQQELNQLIGSGMSGSNGFVLDDHPMVNKKPQVGSTIESAPSESEGDRLLKFFSTSAHDSSPWYNRYSNDG